ncbi:GNAT family N-acetyltransferase [Breznakiella homolactica]|uniref:GNAT family N-acetyltransferase n=2 Tax=Breznakiella homolactica TaxID=2798577 RepID=A0A7T7XQ77_9SPIR|nr:GNAT family N-acetyltransferase [Breznakiella homolactica]
MRNTAYCDCEIIRLYVSREVQGCGIGSQLLEYMMYCYRGLGCRTMAARTLLGARNNSFYLKQGGTENQTQDFEFGGRKYPAVEFTFSLE